MVDPMQDPAYPKPNVPCSLHVTTTVSVMGCVSVHTVVIDFPSEEAADAGRERFLERNLNNGTVLYRVIVLRNTSPTK